MSNLKDFWYHNQDWLSGVIIVLGIITLGFVVGSWK